MFMLCRFGRLGRIGVATLCIAAAGTLGTVPLAGLAQAKNADHGGQNGGHGHDHGNGNGNGNGNGGPKGNAGGHGANGNSSNGNGAGQGNGQMNGQGPSANAGPGNSSKSSVKHGAVDDGGTTDPSLSPAGLGKLNGFFHASPTALAHTSAKSPLGQISQAFRDAASAFAAAQTTTDPNGGTTTPTGPTADDLGAILAGATNKPVTAAQVQAIAGRLAQLNPDDPGLAAFAAPGNEANYQDIADAANAEHQAAGTP